MFQPTPDGWTDWYTICAHCLKDKWRSMVKSLDHDVSDAPKETHQAWHGKLFESMIIALARKGMVDASADMFKLKGKIGATKHESSSDTDEDCMDME